MANTYLKGTSGDTMQWQGNLTVDGTQIFTGGTQYAGDVTLGDAVADTTILKGRLSTSTVAGAALAIDATTYQYAHGAYLRYNVADWADTYTLTDFRALYLRAETNEANATGTLMGAEVYGVANNVGVQDLKGVLSYAYIKGATAKTVATAYAVQAELTFDAGAAATTITTELTPFMAKITGGAANDYTKIHGVIIRSGDMDGASRTYGNAILIQDDAAMAGAITWTKGISIANACTTGISLEGVMTTGISITGASTTAINVAAGGTGVVFKVGAFSSSASLGHVLSSTSKRVFELYADDNTANFGADVQGINMRVLLLGDHTDAYSVTSLRGHLRMAGSDITPSESKAFQALVGYVEADGTYAIGGASIDTMVDAVNASVEIGGTPTLNASGKLIGVHVTGKFPASWSTPPAGETIGIYFQAITQGYEHAFGFSGVGTTDGNGLTTGTDSVNVTHKVAVWINGVGTRYIHLFSD